MKNSKSKEVARRNGIVQNGSLVLRGNLPAETSKEEIEKMLAEDMGRTAEDVVPRLPQIKILHAGACQFKMPPDENGEEAVVGTFEGIIIDKHRCNAWWEKSFAETGGGNPPDCASLDGRHGIVLGGDAVPCATCPHNEFGTAVDEKGRSTRGKACKNMLRLHVWMDGHTLPRRLTLPPTSIKEADSFFSTLIDRGMPMTAVRVKFKLAEASSSQGIKYSQIRFAVLDQIPVEQYYRIKMFLRRHLAQIRGQEITADEYEPDQNGAESNKSQKKDEITEIFGE